MEETHVFELESVWTGDSDGDGMIAAEGRYTDYGRPWQLGGSEGRSNPEELLLAAVASCFSITLALLAEKRRLPLTRIEMKSEADVVRQPDKSLKFTTIRLYPRMVMDGADEAQAKAAHDMAHKADKYCLVSAALRGNVEVEVHPEVAVLAAA